MYLQHYVICPFLPVFFSVYLFFCISVKDAVQCTHNVLPIVEDNQFLLNLERSILLTIFVSKIKDTKLSMILVFLVRFVSLILRKERNLELSPIHKQ